MWMRACDTARRQSLRAAAWAGRRGIAVEAATGSQVSAAHWYGSAKWLATSAAGTAERAYERARGITP